MKFYLIYNETFTNQAIFRSTFVFVIDRCFVFVIDRCFVFVIDRCFVNTGSINKDFLHWDFT